MPSPPINNSVRDDDARGFRAPLSQQAAISVPCNLGGVTALCTLPVAGYYNVVFKDPSADLFVALACLDSDKSPPALDLPKSPEGEAIMLANPGIKPLQVYCAESHRVVAIRLHGGKAGPQAFFVRVF